MVIIKLVKLLALIYQ